MSGGEEMRAELLADGERHLLEMIASGANADPLTAHEVQPAITVAALVRADERLRKSFEEIKLPVLIMHGTEDKATVCHGSEFFYEHAGSEDKTLNLYEGHYHDLLNDLDKEKVMGDITKWIGARIR